ncbi:MAG: lysophospholipid acyltransferase family protein [Janthinobacterium lividum]
MQPPAQPNIKHQKPNTENQRFAWYYYPLQWLLLGLSHLPFVVLYVVARGIYGLLAYVVRYRWRVVLDNLRHAFPEKTEGEIRQIGRRFYWHFAQVLVEILKLATISPADLQRRVRFTNPELMGGPFTENRLVLSLGSHRGNWEWLLSGAELQWPGRAGGVYKSLTNKFFESFMRRLRTRLGAQAVPMLATLRYLNAHRHDGLTLSLLTDQAAGPDDRPYWTNFLHREAGFYTSADRLAPALGCVVLYIGVHRAGRGYYDVTFTRLPDGLLPAEAARATSDTERYPITEAFVRQLEADIRATPEQYLWTHRRWKHKR